MAAMASSTLAAVAIAAGWPMSEWLTAATFQQELPVETPPDFSAPQSSGMEIVPRGKDVSTPTIPFRRSAQPGVQNQLRPTTKTVKGPRGTLQRPVFSSGSSASGSSQHTTSLSQGMDPANSHGTHDQSLRANSVPSSGNVIGTPSSAPTNTTGGRQRSSSLNFVDASGVDQLPYAGQAMGTAGGPGSNRVAARVQDDGTLAFPEIPATDVEVPSAELAPGSPVPSVPAVPNVPRSVPENAVPIMDGEASAGHGQDEFSGSPVGGPEGEVLSSKQMQNSPGITPADPHSPRGAQGGQPRPGHHLQGQHLQGQAPGTSGFRANVEADAPAWIGPYMGRTGLVPEGVEPSPAPEPSVRMPDNFTAWWDGPVQQRAGIAPRSLSVDVTSLVQQALVYSSQVQVLQADPEVQHRVVKQEEAAFDWRAFLDSKYDDLNDPIGNTLTTGNNDTRFTDSHLTSSGGLKRRTTSGAEVKLAQQFGYQDNNSRFLLPNAQSTSRLELSFRQPLMSRSGTVYNQNQIILARISANAAGDETLDELQKHLYGVAESYWKLYRSRAEFFQRQKLLTSSRKVLSTLEGRNQVDTIPRQILRARASVARAESRMQRAVTDIRNAESQLRLLVNDPEMLDGGPVEFTPTELPCMLESPVSLRDSLQTALVNRPDISNAIRQMRASGVRMGVSKSEMLPKLDFIVSSYVAGLENKSQFADSFANQFTQGRPGYTVGLEFEVPLGNRAAKAKVEQRQWELKRAISSFKQTVETSLTEVEITSREVDTAWRELLGKYQAMEAAQNEVSYLQDRFEVLPMVEESSILLLEDLLDGYERLADEEASFALAQTNYALSIIQLRRSTGTMLRSRHDAPELEPTESEWMGARAEQAANEVETRMAGKVVVAGGEQKSARISDPAIVAPVTWSKPILPTPRPNEPALSTATPSARRSDAQSPKSPPSNGKADRPDSADSDSSGPLAPRPRKSLGGHSFGNNF